MIIEILNSNEYIGRNIKPGKYEIILQETPTEKQNAAFHALLQCYWASGAHSYNARNFSHFRALIKLYLGVGMELFYNVINEDGTLCPGGRKDYRLKSWADYTKKERKETIDRLISEMIQAGINSRKFDEILQGLENNRAEKTIE